MNKFFIRTSVEKIELLHKKSIKSIKNIIQELKKAQRTNSFEQKYLKFVDDLFADNLTEKQIFKFLNLKFKKGKVSDYIEICKSPQTNEFEIRLKIFEDIFNLDKGLTDYEKVKYQFELEIKTPIINLITYYEEFIRLLIKSDCWDGNLELIKNNTISLSQLSSLSYDEKLIKNYLINAYCDSKLFGDKKHIREVIKTLGIDCNDCNELLDDFDEVYFRRNMYVHSIQKITSDYLELPDRIKAKWIKENHLVNSPEYFNHAFTTVKKIILMILIKKCLYKEKNNKDLIVIENLIYDVYYANKLYITAEFAYKQLKNLNWITDVQRYFYYVNYMVCLKYTDTKELDKQLNSWNTSTDAPIFKLAKNLIKNDYSNINALIRSILKSDEDYFTLSEEDRSFYLIKKFINEWPLFKDYRDTEHFNSLCEDIKNL